MFRVSFKPIIIIIIIIITGETVYDHNQQQQHHGMQERGGTPRIPSVPPSPCRSIPVASNNINNNLSPSRKTASGLPGPRVPTSGLSSRFGDPTNGSQASQSGSKSFLDKFKPRTSTTPTQETSQVPTLSFDGMARGLGKRTSSSSGFSSARSISSKSSAASVCSDTNFQSPSAMRRIQENVTLQQQQNRIPMPASSQIRSPKQQQRANNQNNGVKKNTKIPNGNSNPGNSRSPCSSPKRSPKMMRAAAAAGATEIKDYGMIDQRVSTNVNYPPHAFPNPGNGKQSATQPQQLFSKIPNPSRLPTSGLQKPSIQPPSGLKMPKLVQTPETLPPHVEEMPAPASPATQARSCSLPRQKREENGPTNVAVVSPMPNSASTPKIDAANLTTATIQKSISVDETESSAKNSVPLAMAPIGGLCQKSEIGAKTLPQHFTPYNCQPTTMMAAFVASGKFTFTSLKNNASLPS